ASATATATPTAPPTSTATITPTATGVPTLAPCGAVNGATYCITDLDTLGGASSHAQAINDLDRVVGWQALSAGGRTHAFLWQSGQMIDLARSRAAPTATPTASTPWARWSATPTWRRGGPPSTPSCGRTGR